MASGYFFKLVFDGAAGALGAVDVAVTVNIPALDVPFALRTVTLYATPDFIAIINSGQI